MQSLVYIFIALAGLGVGATAYFGLTFSPIEAGVTALLFGVLAVVLLERTLRQRSEARLEKAIGDLSRLLSTDAQAGSSLSQRVNALADEQSGKRLEALEADISVLGTVVRQVAEAVGDLERDRQPEGPGRPAADDTDPDTFPEAVIPLETLRLAIAEHRLICHIEPIVRLPKRTVHGYTMVPRLALDEGELADPPEFMPRQGGEDLLAQIEALCTAEAIVIARRSRTGGQPTQLHIPLSRGTLSDPDSLQQLLATLEANRAIAAMLIFTIAQHEYRAFGPKERAGLAAIARTEIGCALSETTTLRIDFAELEGLGFRYLSVNARRFILAPESFTDFHVGDVSAYAKRFDMELIGAGTSEPQQLLGLFENGVTLAQGPIIGAAGPVRADLAAGQTGAGVAMVGAGA